MMVLSRVAIETQTPNVKPVLFLDAYRRMPYQSLFLMSPGQSRIVYLDEITVAGLSVSDVPKLKEKVYKIMEEKLIIITPGGTKEWLLCWIDFKII